MELSQIIYNIHGSSLLDYRKKINVKPAVDFPELYDSLLLASFKISIIKVVNSGPVNLASF